MNLLAWSLQGVCALVFASSGTAKSLMSKDRMIATGQTGVAPFPLPVVRVVAISEIVGAVGLIVPWVTGTAKLLTPVAAGCLVVFMIGAAISHASLSELKQVFFVNTPLAVALAAVVAIRAAQL